MKKMYRAGIAALALAAGPAFAQMAPPLPWYVGAGAGIGNLNASGSDLTNLSNASIDDSDKTYTFRFGYRFHPNFALEAGYYDLGKYTFSGTGPGNTNVSGSFKAKSYGLSFVAIAPLTEYFDVYGRLGYARSELKPNANTSNITYTREDKQSEATYGVGARWMFTKQFGVFGEWMKNDKIEVDSYLFGVDFRF